MVKIKKCWGLINFSLSVWFFLGRDPLLSNCGGKGKEATPSYGNKQGMNSLVKAGEKKKGWKSSWGKLSKEGETTIPVLTTGAPPIFEENGGGKKTLG